MGAVSARLRHPRSPPNRSACKWRYRLRQGELRLRTVAQLRGKLHNYPDESRDSSGSSQSMNHLNKGQAKAHMKT